MRRLVRHSLFFLLSVVGLPRFLSLLRRCPPFARLAARWPLDGGPDCLAASLRGLAGSPSSRLAFGVRRRGGRLEAHAWVEAEGAAPAERKGYHRLGAL